MTVGELRVKYSDPLHIGIMATSKQKKSATVRNPTIEAVVKQLLRLPDEQAALRKMQALEQHFMVSRRKVEGTKRDSLVMWIKGFDVSDKELAQGYLGHFAVIGPKPLPDGRWTLAATKVFLPLGEHPAKKYQPVKQRHPNWGHPILRKIKKGAMVTSVEEAAAMLLKLHEEYPDASIPGELKLYLMVFGRTTPGEKPLKKWVFEICKVEEQLYRIDYYENIRKQDEKKPPIDAKDNPIMGYFTAKTAMKRRKKPKL